MQTGNTLFLAVFLKQQKFFVDSCLSEKGEEGVGFLHRGQRLTALKSQLGRVAAKWPLDFLDRLPNKVSMCWPRRAGMLFGIKVWDPECSGSRKSSA